MMKKRFSFKANITLLATNGRLSPIYTGYRSNFIFDDMENINTKYNISGEVFIEMDILYPGETTNCIIQLIETRTLEHLLTKGRFFKFREGARIVGEGTILEILGFQEIMEKPPSPNTT
jgi:translation elongation factor EF-Tu-like GTPase